MPYRALSHYQHLSLPTYSSCSRPYREQTDGTYEVRLIKSSNPAYIPSDLEGWPIYNQAVPDVLLKHNAAHTATVEAIRRTRKELTGLENAEAPRLDASLIRPSKWNRPPACSCVVTRFSRDRQGAGQNQAPVLPDTG